MACADRDRHPLVAFLTMSDQATAELLDRFLSGHPDDRLRRSHPLDHGDKFWMIITAEHRFHGQNQPVGFHPRTGRIALSQI